MKNYLNIYGIKKNYESKTGGYYFSRSTLKFFHQTLRSFHVSKLNEETYFITAPIMDCRGKTVGDSTRVFDKTSGRLFLSLQSLEEYRYNKLTGREE
jgi:hypothetical protein